MTFGTRKPFWTRRKTKHQFYRDKGKNIAKDVRAPHQRRTRRRKKIRLSLVSPFPATKVCPSYQLLITTPVIGLTSSVCVTTLAYTSFVSFLQLQESDKPLETHIGCWNRFVHCSVARAENEVRNRFKYGEHFSSTNLRPNWNQALRNPIKMIQEVQTFNMIQAFVWRYDIIIVWHEPLL